MLTRRWLAPRSWTLEAYQRAGGYQALRSVLVTEQEILDSLRRVYRDDGQLLEGAAGVAVAAFRKVAKDYTGKTVAILLCGGNVDAALAKQIQET